MVLEQPRFAAGADGPADGLTRRLGPLGLGAAVFNTVVGAGIFVLPGALAHDLGPAAPLAYLACVVIMGAVSLCFACAGSRAPASGGPYGYARAAFGPATAFVVGALVWLGSVLAAGGIASAVLDNLAHALPILAQPAPRAGAILLLFALLAAVNGTGVEPGSRLVGVLTVVKLGPLLLLVAFGLSRLVLARLGLAHAPAPPLHVPPPSVHAFGAAMILALFAFQGMETALGVSGEVRDPARNVPLGLLGAMAAVAALYTGVQLGAQALLGPALAASRTPLVDAAATVAPWLAAVVLAGASLSMLGYLASDMLSAPRLLYSFARDGLAPAGLGRLQPASRAPRRAIWAHGTIAAVLAVTGGFTELAVLSSLTTVVVYAVVCVAALRLQRRGVALEGPPLSLPGLALAAGVGVASCLWIAVHASARDAAGCLASVALALGWFAVARRRGRPGRPAGD